MKKVFLAILVALAVRAIVHAASTPLAWGVTADSANTPNNVVYRDANGSFSAGAITLAAPTAGTTVYALTSVAGQSADLVDISSPTATNPSVRISSGGQFVPLTLAKAQIDLLVPAATGAVIICTNCTVPFSLCTATGTAIAQWARAGSASVGCGTNN